LQDMKIMNPDRTIIPAKYMKRFMVIFFKKYSNMGFMGHVNIHEN